MPRKALVLDANILIRAVLGQRVRRVLETHAENISFFVPATACKEAEEHLSALVVKRGGDDQKALSVLRAMAALTTVVDEDPVQGFRTRSQEAAQHPRSGGLANSRGGTGFWLSDLDRRH